jgi:hypothetical protein
MKSFRFELDFDNEEDKQLENELKSVLDESSFNCIDFPVLDLTDLKQKYVKFEDKFDLDKIELTLRRAFAAFDHTKTNEIDLEDLKTCVYSLNLCPNESQFEEILKDLKIVRPQKSWKKIPIKISYERFSSAIKPIILFRKCPLKSENVLKLALGKLREASNSKLNEIDWKFFEDTIYNCGEVFKYDEFEAMREFLEPLRSKNKLDYESFLKSLISESKEFEDYRRFSNQSMLNSGYIFKSLGFQI